MASDALRDSSEEGKLYMTRIFHQSEYDTMSNRGNLTVESRYCMLWKCFAVCDEQKPPITRKTGENMIS